MEKVYVFFAEGFEEIEGLTVVDILRRAGIDTVMVSIGQNLEVTGSHGIRIKTDLLFDEEALSDGTYYVLPGGMPGTTNLGAHKGLCGLLIKAKAEGKKLAAICAAPMVLGELGLLEGEKAVCFPGREDHLKGAQVLYDPVVVSGNITTSRGMGTAIPFALALLAQIQGEEAAQKLGTGIVYYS